MGSFQPNVNRWSNVYVLAYIDEKTTPFYYFGHKYTTYHNTQKVIISVAIATWSVAEMENVRPLYMMLLFHSIKALIDGVGESTQSK